MAKRLSAKELEEFLRPFPDASFSCRARGCRTRIKKPWNCNACGEIIKDMCVSCHMEIVHDKIPPAKAITARPQRERLGAGYSHVDGRRF